MSGNIANDNYIIIIMSKTPEQWYVCLVCHQNNAQCYITLIGKHQTNDLTPCTWLMQSVLELENDQLQIQTSIPTAYTTNSTDMYYIVMGVFQQYRLNIFTGHKGKSNKKSHLFAIS